LSQHDNIVRLIDAIREITHEKGGRQ
jgi:hypothetical protein